MRQIFALAGALLLGGCGSPTTSNVPTSSGQLPNVAIVRVFDATGADVSGHIPLVTGVADRLEVRLYAADNSRIDFVPGGVRLGFSFDPSNLAQATPVDTLVWNVTPTAPVGTLGSMSISVTLLANNSTKPPFGPYQVLVHPSS